MKESPSELASAERDNERVGDRVASSATLLWSTTMLLRALQFATTAILARILSPDDYGVVVIALIVVGLLDVLSNIQVGSAISRLVNLTQDHLDTAFTLNLLRGVFSSVVLAILARPVALFMHQPTLERVMYLLTISAFLSSIHNPYFLLYGRNLDFWRDSKRNAVAAAVGSLIGIATALALRNYMALVASSIATSFVTAALSYWRVPGRPRLSLAKSSELLSFGSWLVLISILNYINSKVDYLIIGKGLGSNELGAYHIGEKITTMTTGDIVAPLSRALLPAFSLMSDDFERLQNSYRRVQSITLLFALPLGFGTSAVAPDIVLLVVGAKWSLAIPVIQFVAPVIALQSMVASIDSIALAAGRGKLLFYRTSIFLVVRTLLMGVGFLLGGFLGVVYARVVSGLFLLLYGLGLAANITRTSVHAPFVISWRSFLAVLVMWCGVAYLPTVDPATYSVAVAIAAIAGKVLIGGLLYFGTHTLLWRTAGYPDGAEQRFIEQVRRILTRLGPRFGLR